MLDLIKRNLLKMSLFFGGAMILYFLIILSFSYFEFHSFFAPSSKLSDLFTPLGSFMAIAPAGGIIFMGVVALVFESYLLGFDKSSLKRLLIGKDLSTKNDIFYFFLAISGMHLVISIIMSAGLVFLVERYVREYFTFNIVDQTGPFIGFGILYLVNTFIFYWVHRILHSKWLWNIHTVHHSATEMNIITPHRNHPIDRVVVDIFNAIPMAILGATFEMLIIYQILNGWYQQMVHTRYLWTNPMLKRIFITAQDHLIHHGIEEKHWNKNFGILVFWEKLFGTYEEYDPKIHGDIQLGVEDEHANIDGGIGEMLDVYTRFFKNLFSLIRFKS